MRLRALRAQAHAEWLARHALNLLTTAPKRM